MFESCLNWGYGGYGGEYPMVCEETFHAININDLEIGQGPSIRLGQNWSSTLNGFKI
jgi:hypothetical protein